ncbi:MAG: M60 family metallopeptidase [Bacteroidaceae bacterium]|nr:M60 family metallopeptidase [Bacteroidaceae bacterium]
MKNQLRQIATALLLAILLPVVAWAQTPVPSVTAPLYIASDAERTVSFTAQTLKVGVAGTDYTAAVDASWVTAAKTADGVLLTFSKNDADARAATLTITSGGSAKTIALAQQANPFSSIGGGQVAVKTAYASSSESSRENTPITLALDGNSATYYHSTWSSSTTFPVTLTFNFEEPQHLNRILITPRGNGTGVFKSITVSTSTNGTAFLEHGSATYDNTDAQKAYDFGTEGIDGVQSVRISVTAGYNNYISASEIAFIDDGEALSGGFELFADGLYTELRPGVTQADIDAVENPLAKQLAQDLFDGTYSTEFRVGTYEAYRPIVNLQAELLTNAYYDPHENPTGIYFTAGEKVAVMASGIGSSNVQLEVYNFALDGMGANSKYTLHDGLNVFTVTNRGTSYVLYYRTDYATAPTVKLHFLYGSQNGVFNLDTDDNDKWKQLLANATCDVLDIVTPRVHMVAPLYQLQAQCPARGYELAQKLDSVVWREWEMMGLFRHNRAPKNHQFVRPSIQGLFASAEGANCAWTLFGGWVTPVGLESWGLAHELGHNNQLNAFKWVGMTEVTNNIYSAWVQYKLPWSQLRLEDEHINCAIGSVRGGRMQNFLDMDVVKNLSTTYHWQTETEYNGTTIDHFVALVPLWQLVLYTMPAGKAPYAYPDYFEKIRTTSSMTSSTDANKRLNFFKEFSNAAGLNFFPYFEKAGMLTVMNNVPIDDYSSGYLTITQSMINSARNTILRKNFPAVPAEVVYINAYNMHIFRDNVKLDALIPAGTGCTATTMNGHQVVKVDNYAWKGAVGYETYDADGNLLHATIYGLGDTQASDRYTYVIWKTSSESTTPAYIMAVGCDGTRVKCYVK